MKPEISKYISICFSPTDIKEKNISMKNIYDLQNIPHILGINFSFDYSSEHRMFEIYADDSIDYLNHNKDLNKENIERIKMKVLDIFKGIEVEFQIETYGIN